jgi:hypothetical protein
MKPLRSGEPENNTPVTNMYDFASDKILSGGYSPAAASYFASSSARLLAEGHQRLNRLQRRRKLFGVAVVGIAGAGFTIGMIGSPVGHSVKHEIARELGLVDRDPICTVYTDPQHNSKSKVADAIIKEMPGIGSADDVLGNSADTRQASPDNPLTAAYGGPGKIAMPLSSVVYCSAAFKNVNLQMTFAVNELRS